MDDADAALAAEQLEVKNPFPTPPIYWIRYTSENIRLLGLLKDKIREGDNWIASKDGKTEEEPVDQEALLPDEALLPSFPLLELEPPRLDWILEQNTYESFGEVYQTNETTQELPPDIKRLYDLEPGSDPRPHLRQLLVSLLNAYHKLLSDILEPVPSGYHKPCPDLNGPGEGQMNGEIVWPPPLNWEATVLWIRTLVLNLGSLVNEFRPIQARMALESMMQRQIDIRREETKIIHGKCDELERTLADLRAKTSSLLPPSNPDSAPIQEGLMEVYPTFETEHAAEAQPESTSQTPMPILTTDDLIAWSQEGFAGQGV